MDRFSGLARRHRLAYNDGEWPWSFWMGRGRNRSGGRHVGPAALDADSRCDRFQTVRSFAGRRNGDGPCSHRDAHVAKEGCRRQVRGILRDRAFQPHASRSRHHRQHGARIWRDDGILSRGCGDTRLLAIYRAKRRTGKAGRSVHEGTGPFPH